LTNISNLNPGGYIELQDAIYPMSCDDGTLQEDSALLKWSMIMNEAFRANGRPLDLALTYEKELADAGFVNIHVVREKWPTNGWARDKKYKQLGEADAVRKKPQRMTTDLKQGLWGTDNFLSGIGSWTLAIFTRPHSENGLGWSREEVEVLLSNVRKEVKDTNIHAYIRV
jgi:hypothetical protein